MATAISAVVVPHEHEPPRTDATPITDVMQTVPPEQSSFVLDSAGISGNASFLPSSPIASADQSAPVDEASHSDYTQSSEGGSPQSTPSPHQNPLSSATSAAELQRIRQQEPPIRPKLPAYPPRQHRPRPALTVEQLLSTTPKPRGPQTRLLPKNSVSAMHKWLNENLHHPYPGKDDMHYLVQATGLTDTQVSNWFNNTRRRHRNLFNVPATCVPRLLAYFQENVEQPFPDAETLQQLGDDTGLTAEQVNLWICDMRTLNRNHIREACQWNNASTAYGGGRAVASAPAAPLSAQPVRRGYPTLADSAPASTVAGTMPSLPPLSSLSQTLPPPQQGSSGAGRGGTAFRGQLQWNEHSNQWTYAQSEPSRETMRFPVPERGFSAGNHQAGHQLHHQPQQQQQHALPPSHPSARPQLPPSFVSAPDRLNTSLPPPPPAQPRLPQPGVGLSSMAQSLRGPSATPSGRAMLNSSSSSHEAGIAMSRQLPLPGLQQHALSSQAVHQHHHSLPSASSWGSSDPLPSPAAIFHSASDTNAARMGLDSFRLSSTPMTLSSADTDMDWSRHSLPLPSLRLPDSTAKRAWNDHDTGSASAGASAAASSGGGAVPLSSVLADRAKRARVDSMLPPPALGLDDNVRSWKPPGSAQLFPPHSTLPSSLQDAYRNAPQAMVQGRSNSSASSTAGSANANSTARMSSAASAASPPRPAMQHLLAAAAVAEQQREMHSAALHSTTLARLLSGDGELTIDDDE
eukprot:TRINITY_DN4755_c0_g1_i1.p1 TRINITY_DN4755_c0_g1~~TRINITY_DN4755_c0_g1_i1.p1  ORF type:complete len:745 (+),score=152.52 TRINITY_DN4755_c0_g1_i1:246-2480(+)